MEIIYNYLTIWIFSNSSGFHLFFSAVSFVKRKYCYRTRNKRKSLLDSPLGFRLVGFFIIWHIPHWCLSNIALLHRYTDKGIWIDSSSVYQYHYHEPENDTYNRQDSNSNRIGSGNNIQKAQTNNQNQKTILDNHRHNNAHDRTIYAELFVIFRSSIAKMKRKRKRRKKKQKFFSILSGRLVAGLCKIIHSAGKCWYI